MSIVSRAVPDLGWARIVSVRGEASASSCSPVRRVTSTMRPPGGEPSRASWMRFRVIDWRGPAMPGADGSNDAPVSEDGV